MADHLVLILRIYPALPVVLASNPMGCDTNPAWAAEISDLSSPNSLSDSD
jgi:hypothetical protein